MKHLLNKDAFFRICENYKITVNSSIYIHHPVTEDLIIVNVKELQRDKVLVSIPEDSPYLGQPDWYIKKINIIGTV